MIIKKETKDQKDQSCNLLQHQVIHELENERLYFEMASWCDHNNLPETAKFFAEHTHEERNHALDFMNHGLMQGIRVKFGPTKEMKSDYKDLMEVLEDSLAREKETSAMIQNMYEIAEKEKTFLITIAQKYIKEQLEEEQLFLSVLSLWKKCTGSKIDFEMEIGKVKSCGAHKRGALPQ